jgi:hypothetical protein
VSAPFGPDADSVAGDVCLVDDEGRLLVEVRGLRARRLGRDSPAAEENTLSWLYEVQWRPGSLPQALNNGHSGRSTASVESWLLFTDQGDVGSALRLLLQEQGHRCVTVRPGEDFAATGPDEYRLVPGRAEHIRQLFAEVFREEGPPPPSSEPARAQAHPRVGVVHLWSLDMAAPDQINLASLSDAVTLGCASVLSFVQEAFGRSLTSLALWLVTKGAQQVGDEGPPPVEISQTMLWGLGKVIALEHPGVRCACVDLDPQGGQENARFLCKELQSTDSETQVAFRRHLRYAPRLTALREGVTARSGKGAPALDR